MNLMSPAGETHPVKDSEVEGQIQGEGDVSTSLQVTKTGLIPSQVHLFATG